MNTKCGENVYRNVQRLLVLNNVELNVFVFINRHFHYSDIAKICSNGIAMKPPKFYFASKSVKHFIQCNEHGGSFLMKCCENTVWCHKKMTCDLLDATCN